MSITVRTTRTHDSPAYAIVATETSNFHAASPKSTPVASSINGYLIEMRTPQLRHLPPRIR